MSRTLKFKIEDKTPEPNQYITAKIKYPITYDKENEKYVYDKNATTIVHGQSMKKNPTVVIYDFYSGTAAADIIEWEERTPDFDKNCHPYASIEHGVNK
jgi:hypothetical protein